MNKNKKRKIKSDIELARSRFKQFLNGDVSNFETSIRNDRITYNILFLLGYGMYTYVDTYGNKYNKSIGYIEKRLFNSIIIGLNFYDKFEIQPFTMMMSTIHDTSKENTVNDTIRVNINIENEINFLICTYGVGIPRFKDAVDKIKLDESYLDYDLLKEIFINLYKYGNPPFEFLTITTIQ